MGTRIMKDGAERVYQSAQVWVDAALRSDSSLFTPGETIWSSRWLGELRERFLDQPDLSNGSFLEKLQGQLAGATPEVHQLMAEALYFHLLIGSTKDSRNKRRNIQTVLGWSPSPSDMTPELIAGLTPGIANPGPYFNFNKDTQIGFLIEFVEQWKQLEPDHRRHRLSDPWEFKDFVMTREFVSKTLTDEPNSFFTQREALLHLVFPDAFEAIVSSAHKKEIAEAFAKLVDNPAEDVDRRLAQIRPEIESRYGIDDYIYYQPEVRTLWPDGHSSAVTDVPPTPPSPEEGAIKTEEAISLDELAQELLWEPDRLRMIIHGLEDKGQVIFQGPPGTGKTFVARRIAQWYREQGGDYRIVQFHPSYTYEDFVEGFRPARASDGQVGYDLVPGPLRNMTEHAQANPDATFILVIDEINRGNVAKVLGELYFLLEYRDEAVNLQYSREPFRLPKNLWLIGTMNTTDRSIALVDAALRRRFYFFGFYPDEPPVRGLLRRWLETNNPEAMWVADLVDAANRKLNDRHLGIGPSHFMKKDPPLDKARVRFIWEQAVIPYIEEQSFGDEVRLKEFGYDQLISELGHSAVVHNGDDDQPEGATAGGAVEHEDGSDGATS